MFAQRSSFTAQCLNWLLLVAMVISLSTFGLAQSKKPDGSSDDSTKQSGAAPLSTKQSDVAERYKRLEELLIKIAEMESTENPTRSALLQQAAQLGKQSQIADLLARAASSLDKQQYSQAIEDQKTAKENLKRLLELLQSENRPDRVREERDQVQRWIEEADRLRRLQSSLRGRTEGGQQTEKAAADQAKLAEKADQIAKEIAGEDPNAKSPDKDDKSDKDKNDKESNSPNKDNGEGKDSQSKDSQSKDSQSKDSQSKDSSNKEDSKKSDDSMKPKGDAADQKDKTEKDKTEKDVKDSKDSQDPQEKPSDANKDSQDSSSKDPKESSDKKDPSKDGSQSEKSSEQSPSKESPNSESNPSQSNPSNEQNQSKQGQQQQQQQQQPQSPTQRAAEKLKKAQERMREAEEQLKEAERQGAVEKQRQAEQELQAAIEQLEEILRQLREEEIERSLAALESRLRAMLQSQNKVLEETVRLQEIGGDNTDRQVAIRASNLSVEERKILADGQRALLLLREEGTSAAFPEAMSQVLIDVQNVVDRLAKADTGKLTVAIEKEIISSLEEMIEALVAVQKEQKERKEKQQSQGQQQGQPGEQPLVDKLAELRLIRTLQVRVNKRTQSLSEALKDPNDVVGQAEAADIQDELKGLAGRQSSIQQVTRDIVVGKTKQ